MLCRACAEDYGKGARRRVRSRGGSSQLCVRCGDLLGAEMELSARRKKSQLEQFGLAGWRRLLRKRNDIRA